jgi:endonuclease YncB( thermonuclease family)
VFGFTVTKDRIEVVDGDSIRIVGEKADYSDSVLYRLIGYDAPETFRPKTEHEHGWGMFATEKMKETIARAGRLRLRPKLLGQRWSRNSRLAWLYVDGVDVAAIAIREGWGHPFRKGDRRPKWGRLDD